MADHSQKWHNVTSTRTRSTDTSDGLDAIQALLNNLGREIKKVNERVRLIDNSNEGKMVLVELIDREKSATNLKKLLMEKLRMGYQIKASTNMHDSANLEDSLPPKEKRPMEIIKRPKGIAKNVLVGIDKFVFLIDFIVLDMSKDIKVPLILGRPFLSTAHAKIDVFKRKITLRIKDDKRLRERMKLDLEARLIGEALILNRSLDHIYGDYIELNDLNEPLELRRNQVEDLGSRIEDAEVINKPMEEIVKTRNDDNEISNGIDKFPSFCDFDKKIYIDCAYNLQFSCMIDKIQYKGKNVVRAFINVPIFVGNFSVVTDFSVVEIMDAYLDEGMSDVIFVKPFCREICVKARRFNGMITIYNGNDSVTYQMA
ncbi:uncharacterized mitochondrial protein-like protein [Tanacetum coccineum]|uniref:Uncharacterized mitochondrial protein-like protein n=1 Tax=Tanacetum coccineum TaxID=301880 RepID=A0ABQ5I326_9ASTR